MAQYLSNQLAGDTTGLTTVAPAGVRPNANEFGARMRNYRATIKYASQASGSTFLMFTLPAGCAFQYADIVSDTSSGSATIAIGTAASPGKYRAAATFTTTNTPTPIGLGAAVAGPYAADEVVIATIAAAALPAGGTLVIDFQVLAP